MAVTQGSRRDRRGPRIITKKLFSKDCHMLQRSFHIAEEHILQLCGCNWVFLGKTNTTKNVLGGESVTDESDCSHPFTSFSSPGILTV